MTDITKLTTEELLAEVGRLKTIRIDMQVLDILTMVTRTNDVAGELARRLLESDAAYQAVSHADELFNADVCEWDDIQNWCVTYKVLREKARAHAERSENDASARNELARSKE